jgi:hypothetical protein
MILIDLREGDNLSGGNDLRDVDVSDEIMLGTPRRAQEEGQGGKYFGEGNDLSSGKDLRDVNVSDKN